MVINFYFRKNLFGFSLIEALLAGSLLALIVFTLSSIMIFGQESSRIAGDRQRAAFLAEEGMEAVRNMSEASFSSLTNGSHGLAIASNKWQFSGTQDNPEIFTRTISIADFNSYTKSVTSTVAWDASAQRAGLISLNSRFTDWRRVGVSNWASTTVESGYGTTTNTRNGIRVKVDGNYAYVALVSGTNNFLIFDISSPAVPKVLSRLSVSGNITDMEVLGNYVYITSTNNTYEMRVVNVTNKLAPTLAGYFDAPGSGDGRSIDVLGNRAYLGRLYSSISGQGELYVIDISNPNSIPASTVHPTWVYNFAANTSVFDIQVSSDLYAYLATNNNTAELSIIDVSNPGSMGITGTYDIIGDNTSYDAGAISIFDSDFDGIEDRAIVARNAGGKLWPINISCPSSPASILGATGFTVTGISTVAINELSLFNSNKYIALATNNGTAELAIVNITDLAPPTVLSLTNISGTTNFSPQSVAYAAGVDRLLLVGVRPTAAPNYILQIIKPN